MQVQDSVQEVSSSNGCLNDSFEDGILAFLIDGEAQLHTYDDLTKVNPVTPTTGKNNSYSIFSLKRF